MPASPANPYDELRIRCGFGRLGLCCTDCLQGPCRISPFATHPEHGLCGRGADTIAAHQLLRVFASGLGSLAGELATAGRPVPEAPAIAALAGAVADNGAAGWPELLGEARLLAGRLLMAGPVPAWTDAPRSVEDVEVGAAPLQTGHPRLLIAGHIPPSARQALVEAGFRHGVQILGIAGGEDLASGVPWVGSFADMPGILEAVPFGGLVAGSGCVPPLLLTAAGDQGLLAHSLPTGAAGYAGWAERIVTVTLRPSIPSNRPVSLSENGAFVSLDWPSDLVSLAKAGGAGLALIVGCSVRPGEATELARELLAAGFACFTAGCAAPELVKAGPGANRLAKGARTGLLVGGSAPPPVRYAGTCRQARRVVEMAARLRDRTGNSELPLAVAVPGISQPSMAAIALGLAAQGARVHCGAALPVGGSQAVRDWLAAGERYGAGPLYTDTDPPAARQVVARLRR